MNQRFLRVSVVFALVYIALYFLSFLGSSVGLAPWLAGNGPLDFSNFRFSRLDWSLWLLPVVGFFLVYMGLTWLSKEFEFGQIFRYSFPAIFCVASYIAFTAAVFYYFQNQASLGGVDIAQFNLNYWNYFISSAFIYFVLAGLGGWGARMLIDSLEGSQPSKAEN